MTETLSDGFEKVDDIPHRIWATGSVFLGATSDELLQRGGANNPRIDRSERRHGKLDLLVEHFMQGITQKWRSTGEHFEKQDTERIDVGSWIERHPHGLLGRHVCWRSNDRTGKGNVLGVGHVRFDGFDQPEIEEFNEAP